MLEYTRPGDQGRRLLVHHDDDTGRGDEPYDRDVTVVSVRDDWAAVFPTV